MSQIKTGASSIGKYPANLVATVTLSGAITGTFTIGETVTATGFSAKVVSWNATTKVMKVKKVVGNPTAATTLTGGTSVASGAITTINTGTSGGLSYAYGGFNLKESAQGITRTRTVGSRVIVEVMFAVAGLSTKRTS